MFSHPFIVHAFTAGIPIALAAGLVGYFLVLRGQVFTSDALGHVAFAGALGALAAGLDARLGLFAVTAVVAVGLGLLGENGRADDVVIGSTFAWVLGLGVFFLALYTESGNTTNGSASVTFLFGSIYGLSASAALLAAAVAVGLSVAVLAVARPLLFSSLDPAVAAARGVPVRALGTGFLVLVGAVTAEATQAVGALLVFGLVAAPAAAAQRLTSRPYAALGLSAALAVGSMWAGLTLAYAVPVLPPSFAVLAVATATYALAAAANLARRQAVAA